MMKVSNRLVIVFISSIISLVVTAQKGAGFKLPPYEKITLPNGLTINLMEQHEVPMITVTAIIPAGAIYDGDKNGLASLTAESLKHGTKSYTKNQLEEELDYIGAELNTFAAKESAGVSAVFAARDQDKVLNIFKEVLIDPTFNKDEFEKEKKRSLAFLEQEKESPRGVLGSYWDKLYYGNHVYGNKLTGSLSTVSDLKVEDLKKFYQGNYIPNGSAISIVGDFKTADMKAKLVKLFSGWKKSNVPQPSLAVKPVPIPAAAKVLLVNKDDAKETTLIIGGPGIKRNNPDFIPLQVVNTAFGGRFTSWLNDELRVNTGLTYGAGSRFSSLKNAGTFYISTFTATKSTEPTIDKALEVLDKLHKQGLDERTLTSAKNYVKGQFPPRYETAGQLAGLLNEMFWYGFDESFINNFQKNVDELTVAKAKEIVAKYYPNEKLQFVFIGKSEDIKKIVQKFGPVTEVQIKDDKLKAF
jgi:zinc protease